MKNFPHQINRLDKLLPGLRVFANLDGQNQSLSDDGVVGEGLATEGVYTFRDKVTPLPDLLATERAKPESSQGTRTCARDLRRFFTLLQFLERRVDGAFRVTSRTGTLLAAEGNIPERNRLFREALLDLALHEAGYVSHPYRILVRLVDARPGLPVEFLGLALEAEDDSEQEFERLLDLIDEHDWHEVCQIIEVSMHQARNSIKILPALARQIGDIYEAADGRYYLTGTIPRPAPPPEPGQPVTRARPQPRHVTAAEIASQPFYEEERDDPNAPLQDPESIRAAFELRQERSIRHNAIVRELAEMLEQAGCELLEWPFDCLGLGESISNLGEVKTLDESIENERLQVRACLAQLCYYERFDIPVAVNRGTLKKLAVFEAAISPEHQTFLEDLDCLVLWKAGNVFMGTARGLALLRSMGVI